MLSAEKIQEIKTRVAGYWNDSGRIAEVAKRGTGKESGHRIADYVDDKTTSFIHAHYEAAFERDGGGEITKRSMGDLWLKESGVYHPVNIKTGMSNSGSPNMVALRKLLKCLLQNQIDSYYLLMVKFVSHGGGAPAIYFVDMLDYLDYLSFDSGPGQIMLKSEAFFGGFEPKGAVSRTFPEKADYLMAMLEDGDRRLIANREQKRGELRGMIEQYKCRENFAISADDQAEFNLKS